MNFNKLTLRSQSFHFAKNGTIRTRWEERRIIATLSYKFYHCHNRLLRICKLFINMLNMAARLISLFQVRRTLFRFVNDNINVKLVAC
jgi:hypothetical protein